jgi:shikimate dehydrogenase
MDWQITGRTRVWVHVAHPSAQVKATQIVNQAFRDRGLDVVAISIDVAPEDMPSLVRGLKGWRNLVGIGVTMPHKERIVSVCDEVVGLAKSMMAVNLIRREANGRLVGTNNDGMGFLAGLRRTGYDLTGKRVLLVGTGGAGTAIAFNLAEAGVRTLVLSNRTTAKAEQVAARVAEAFPNTSVAVGAPDPAGFDLVINATSLGMREGDELPLDVSRLSSEMIVADVIVTPARTMLLEAAERCGCRTQPGLPMLTCQIDEVITFLRLDQQGTLTA